MTQPSPQPGWYPDPSGTPGQRYWDGQQWMHYAPPPQPQPQPQPSIIINNTVGAPAPVVVTTGPNHALHLVLTLLTFGMWLPVWLIVAIAGHRRVYVTGQPARSNAGLIIGGLFGGLFLLGLAITYWHVFLGLVALAGLGYLGYRAYERAVDRRAEQAKVAARADAENRAFMSGDSSGIYGAYPPVQPPDPRR
jgi:threonine/homoserine/homoserine lactone efflux protein